MGRLRCASLAGDNGCRSGMILRDQLRRKGPVEGRMSPELLPGLQYGLPVLTLRVDGEDGPINTCVPFDIWE